MREIQVPGGEPPNNRPAQRWSVEMDEMDALRELQQVYSGDAEDILDFVRGDNRSLVVTAARQAIQNLTNPEKL